MVRTAFLTDCCSWQKWDRTLEIQHCVMRTLCVSKWRMQWEARPYRLQIPHAKPSKEVVMGKISIIKQAGCRDKISMGELTDSGISHIPLCLTSLSTAVNIVRTCIPAQDGGSKRVILFERCADEPNEWKNKTQDNIATWIKYCHLLSFAGEKHGHVYWSLVVWEAVMNIKLVNSR